MRFEWRLVQENCTGCGICADVCGSAAIRMPREAAYPQGVAGACTGCMACVEECPFGAVEVAEVESDAALQAGRS